VDATQAPFAQHYRMWSYVTEELPALVAGNFPVDMGRQAITGHSMGGHGALTIGLTFPDRYRSVSAFAPIVAPGQVPWGEKALGGYLGDDRAAWRKHDAVALIEDGARVKDLLVDQGAADNSWPGSCGRSCWRRRVRRRESSSRCGCSRATITAITSSRPSWRITSAGTQRG